MIRLPELRFDYLWLRDKYIILEPIPHTNNYHLMITDDDDDLYGLWLIERV